MKLKKKFKNSRFIDSIRCSLEGLISMLQDAPGQRSSALLLFSILFCIFANPCLTYKVWLLSLPILILCIESLNTSVEHACDEITLEYSLNIKKAKDIASCASMLLGLLYTGILLFSIKQLLFPPN